MESRANSLPVITRAAFRTVRATVILQLHTPVTREILGMFQGKLTSCTLTTTGTGHNRETCIARAPDPRGRAATASERSMPKPHERIRGYLRTRAKAQGNRRFRLRAGNINKKLRLARLTEAKA